MSAKTPDALMRLPQVLATVPVSRSIWYLRVKQGIYPQPIKIGPRIVAWRASEVHGLVERIAAGEVNHA